MSPVFGDSYYFLALLNPRDSAHEDAIAVGAGMSGRLVTTHYVLTEVGDAFASARDRPKFLALLKALESDQGATVVPASDDLFRSGIELYRDRPDKDWSLTDCLSFVVMRENGIVDALTADHHFAQAGFRALLSSR